MKLYTPLEMSEKLVKLGCVSQSGMFHDGKGGVTHKWVFNEKDSVIENMPAFEFEDFAGPRIHAIENAKKVWGEEKFYQSGLPDGSFSFYMGITWEINREKICRTENWVEEVGRGL